MIFIQNIIILSKYLINKIYPFTNIEFENDDDDFFDDGFDDSYNIQSFNIFKYIIDFINVPLKCKKS